MKPVRIGEKTFFQLCDVYTGYLIAQNDTRYGFSCDKSSLIFRLERILLQRCFRTKKPRLSEKMRFIVKQLCSFGPDQICEHDLGYFEAIALGVVLFISDSGYPPGLIERSKNPRRPFELRPFFSLNVSNPPRCEMHIFPSQNIDSGGWERHHAACPVFVRWTVDGRDESLMGITNLRWLEMSTWLDKWLPFQP